MSDYRIAVIAGDGIGREVMPEGVRVLEAAGAKHGLRLQWQEFPGAPTGTRRTAGCAPRMRRTR
jgi:isocitrate/isopropylmalate dehydrogenase